VPAGLLVAGDPVCAFYPVYAQGMSVAAMTMLVLRDELRRAAEPDPLRFYGAVSTLLLHGASRSARTSPRRGWLVRASRRHR
jgi:hypothetical protein